MSLGAKRFCCLGAGFSAVNVNGHFQLLLSRPLWRLEAFLCTLLSPPSWWATAVLEEVEEQGLTTSAQAKCCTRGETSHGVGGVASLTLVMKRMGLFVRLLMLTGARESQRDLL